MSNQNSNPTPSQVEVNIPAIQRGRDRTTSLDLPANLPPQRDPREQSAEKGKI